eukprot:gene9747-10744_t
MAETEEELQCRAEIFRSKLIEHFHLLDNIADNGAEEVPKYYSDDVKQDASMDSMMKSFPNALVKFETYSKTEEMIYTDRRLNRIKTKNTIPFGPWAKMVVEEIQQMSAESLCGLKVFLNIFDQLSLMVFVLEIMLKWIDGFVVFWKNGWNVFDFFITIMSFVPELISLSPGQSGNKGVKIIADNLRTFRILRSLKMVSRFAQLRIIVLTILKALKSMAFILMLLATFMYIFAVTGTVMFKSHANSKRQDVMYKDSFSNLVNSFLTLFQLFTLDHWFEIMIDLEKEVNSLFSKLYIVLWICVGSFIFKNVFTGIMVMNFQNIRNDFIMQCKEHEQAIKEEKVKAKLEEELAKQYRSHSISAGRRSSVVTNTIIDPDAVREFNKGNTGVNKTTGFCEEITEEEGRAGEENEADKTDDHDDTITDLNRAGVPTLDVEPDQTSIEINLSSINEISQNIQTEPTSDSQNSTHSTDTRKHVFDVKTEVFRNEGTGVEDISSENPGDAPKASKFAWGPSVLGGSGNLGQEEDKGESVYTKEYKGFTVWNKTVNDNLPNMKSSCPETLWPRDSLFDYFQLMEALQDNLAERHQLQKLAKERCRFHLSAMVVFYALSVGCKKLFRMEFAKEL